MTEVRVMSKEEAEKLPGEKLIISPSSIYSRLGSRTGRLPSQKKFAELSKKNKFVWNVGGWRAGKSGEACVQGLLAALVHPNSYGAVLRQVEASIDDSIGRTWFQICPPEVIKGYNSSTKHLYLVNGSEVVFRGFDKVRYVSKLRSVELDWFIVCQAEEISLDNFRLLQSRLNGRRGPLKGWLEGNPPPSSHWLWQEFVEDPKPGFAFVQSSTLENRDNLPPDYIDDLLSVNDEDWIKRFVYGERTSFKGLVFPQFDRAIHVLPEEQLPLASVDRWVLLKDWGWSNPGVSLVAGITNDDQWVVVEEVYRRETPVSSPLPAEQDWISIDKELVQRWKIERGYADPSRPDDISMYRSHGLPLYPGENDVQAGIELIRELLARETADGRGLVISESCANLIREFENYKFQLRGGDLTEQPLKRDDHGIDALKAGLLAEAEALVPSRRHKAADWVSHWEEAPTRPSRWSELWSR